VTWLRKWIIELILNKEVKPMLKGYVTYISAALMIVTGGLDLLGLTPGFMTTTLHGWDLVMAGLTTLGIGRKLATIETK